MYSIKVRYFRPVEVGNETGAHEELKDGCSCVGRQRLSDD